MTFLLQQKRTTIERRRTTVVRSWRNMNCIVQKPNNSLLNLRCRQNGVRGDTEHHCHGRLHDIRRTVLGK